MKQRKREERALARDEEIRLQEEIEHELEEDVRYLWRRTREMAGHDGWRDVQDPLTGEWFCTGCDCNIWNREALRGAIKRLRAWRTRREYWV